jgi:hypothetical protein
LMGRRAFATAQAAFAGEPAGDRERRRMSVGWHAPEFDTETGYFALVDDGDVGAADLIGEIVKVTIEGRSIYVYVLGARALPTRLSLCRQAFVHLARLSLDSVDAIVEVV